MAPIPGKLTESADDEAGLHRKVTFAFGGSLAIVVVDRLIQILITAVLARVLHPGDFGVVTAATVFVSFLTLLSQMGVGAVLIQMPQRDPRLWSAAMYGVVFLALVAMLVAEIAAPLIGGWFHNPSVTQVVRVLCLNCVIQALTVVPNAALMRALRARTVSLIELVSSAIGFGGVAVPLAFSGVGYWALIGGAIAQSTIRTALMWVVARPQTHWTFAPAEILSLWRRGSGYLLTNVLNKIGAEGDRWVVGRQLSPTGLGLYSKASGLMTAPARLYGAVFDRVAFPAFARVQTEKERMRRAYEDALSLTAVVGLPLTVLLVFTAPQLILMVLGPQWVGTIGPFKILSLAIYVRLADRVNAALLRGIGRPFVVSGVQVFYGLVVFAGGLWAARFGIEAAALLVAVAALLANLLLTTVAMRVVDLSLGRLLPANLPGIASAVLTFATLAAATRLAHHYGLGPFGTLALAGLSIGAAGMVALVAAPRLFLGEPGLRVLGVVAPWSGKFLSRTA